MSLDQEISPQKIPQNNPEDFILKAASLTPVQVQTLLKTKNSKGKTLEELLKNKKTADSILSELCRFLNIRFLSDISFSSIDEDLISGLSIQYVKTHNILPFKRRKKPFKF